MAFHRLPREIYGEDALALAQQAFATFCGASVIQVTSESLVLELDPLPGVPADECRSEFLNFVLAASIDAELQGLQP